MIAFMFAVLGSLMFWAAYVPLSVVMGLIVLGKFDKRLPKILTGITEANTAGKLLATWFFFGAMLTWPIAIAGWIIVHIFFNQVTWGVFSGLMKKVDSAIPEVKITFGPNDGAGTKGPEDGAERRSNEVVGQ